MNGTTRNHRLCPCQPTNIEEISRPMTRSHHRKTGATRIALLGATLLISSCVNPPSRLDENTVTIFRDQWNLPYSTANTLEDSYFGVGYALAADRGERYLDLVLLGTGTWAKHKGNETTFIGAPAVAMDLEAHRWRHPERARAAYGRLDPRRREILDNFVAGFTSYYDDNPNEEPDWAPALAPWHPLAAVRGLMWPFTIAGQGMNECRSSGADIADAGPLEEAGGTLASNQWMLFPRRTASGGAVHLSDPHGPIDGGMIFSEYTVATPRFTANIFGIGPIPLTAASNSLTWGMTTGGPDVADCYAIAYDSDSPNRYRFDGEEREVVRRTVTIEVKGDEPIEREFRYTEHNGVLSPVVGQDDTHLYAVSTPYMDMGGIGSGQLLQLMESRSVGQAKEVLATPSIFPQNILIADRRGAGIFIHNGRTPIRDPDIDWTGPVDGNSSETLWTGIHPLSDLVTTESRASGYLKNTNEAPRHVTQSNSPIDPADYPAYLYTDPGFANVRSYRLNTLLERTDAFEDEDISATVFDEFLPHTDRWRQALTRALGSPASQDLSSEARDVASDILDFDGHMSQDSPEAARYYLWRRSLAQTLPSEQMLTIYGPGNPTGEVGELSTDVLVTLLEGLSTASDILHADFAGEETRLGDVFKLGRGDDLHPIGGATVCGTAGGGWCEETLRAFNAFGANADGVFVPRYGSRMIRLTRFDANTTRVRTAFNFGQSSNPDSPHHDDQAANLFSRKALKDVAMSLEAIRDRARSRIELSLPSNGR